MRKKLNTFHVIGGRDAYVYYGAYDTLDDARSAADENIEYWGRGYGCVTPKIYRDIDVVMCSGIVKLLAGSVEAEVVTIVPIPGAKPVRYEEDL